MSIIDLTEYRDSTAVPLSVADADFVSTQLPRKVSIKRPLSGSGYILNPNQFVGVVRLPSGRLLRCNPKVPVESLASMLAVGLELPALRPEVVRFASIDVLLEIVAQQFAGLVLGRVDAGLHRDYVEKSENQTFVRGRIDFAEDIRLNHTLRHKVFSRYAELTWDIPENQVIRQVVRLLAAQPFSTETRNQLRAIDASMGAVSLGRLTSRDVQAFRYHRLTEDYRPIHRLCSLFLEGASLSDELGSFDGRAFLVDMNKLFESYVSELVRENAPSGVTVETQGTIYLDTARRVRLVPDIVIRRDGRVAAVADCKYKLAAPDEFKNHDVYQVLTYCVATGAQVGMLIYPVFGQSSIDALSVATQPIGVLRAPFDLEASTDEVSGHAARLVDQLLSGLRSPPVSV